MVNVGKAKWPEETINKWVRFVAKAFGPAAEMP